MIKLKLTMDAFYERSSAFNEQLNALDVSYDDYVRTERA